MKKNKFEFAEIIQELQEGRTGKISVNQSAETKWGKKLFAKQEIKSSKK